ncbi:MAG: hypothetical protein K1X86_16140 [Ignavibacteria bacterium]|nr:hypothetical protein [Ignavibacteria bacterium]
MSENKSKYIYSAIFFVVIVICAGAIYFFAIKNRKEQSFGLQNAVINADTSVGINEQKKVNNELKKNVEHNESNLESEKKQDSLTMSNDVPIDKILKIAKAKFKSYLPKIEKTNDAKLDLMNVYTGDFTGDGRPDIAIYFALAPAGGGNALAGQGIVFYENTGRDVKVIAGYEPDYSFNFDKILGGKVYVFRTEYAQNDARCCPSIKIKKELSIVNGKVQDRDVK